FGMGGRLRRGYQHASLPRAFLLETARSAPLRPRRGHASGLGPSPHVPLKNHRVVPAALSLNEPTVHASDAVSAPTPNSRLTPGTLLPEGSGLETFVQLVRPTGG